MWKIALLLIVLVAVVLQRDNASASASASASCPAAQQVFRAHAAPPPSTPFCPVEVKDLRNAIYILYDVNPPEGFNLRRDVYIRLAVFVKQLQQRQPLFANVRLVLPPWRRLYHWKSTHIQQDNLPWSAFFDVESLRRYAPVLDFPEFLEEIGKFGLPETRPPFVPVHRVFQLLHFEEMFENGVFHDKFEFAADCRREQHLHGHRVLQQSILEDLQFQCVRFQGSAQLLERVFRQALRQLAPHDVKVFAVLNAEIVLHDRWGDREFWRARRSMRFAAPLHRIADEFRARHLSAGGATVSTVSTVATVSTVRVQRPPMWELERPWRGAQGGAYLCAHLRRGDFVYGREKTTPTLKSAAAQIRHKMRELNVTQVFLATDATAFELTNLRAHLQRARLVRFTAASLQQKAQIRDGGLAIVDQLVCAHARHFIGTYESTFTYRIYEEREILGFPKSATFNTLCKSDSAAQHCARNTVWSIVY